MESRRRSTRPRASPGSHSPPATRALTLTDRQRRHLRGLAHSLKPIVRLGTAGLSEAVVLEARRALDHHELVKVKIPGGDRAGREELLRSLAARTASALVQRIGNVAVIYRPNAVMARILLPDG